MKLADYTEQAQVVNQSWIDVAGFMKIVPVGQTKARQAMKAIIAEMDERNEPHFSRLLVPTDYVIEKYHIRVSSIRKQAERIAGNGK